eukprot:gnl/TRDRNA2_/TRDRNA2_157837_c1_seq1.p1 gnl/TRDRNA2_/TRDRNA2_157837_c1~~gnl/TRDRNA2_/TRDRNA2_157837_c1_seq1.p1  ORF type:complete len:527 (-),score=89.97 gnl/TRDRNA2_/TRDRNA2_157837_c1_seq1:30-1472(-)
MDSDETLNWESGDWDLVRKSLAAKRAKSWKKLKPLLTKWKKSGKNKLDEQFQVDLASAWWKALGSTILHASTLIELDEPGMASVAKKELEEVLESFPEKAIFVHRSKAEASMSDDRTAFTRSINVMAQAVVRAMSLVAYVALISKWPEGRLWNATGGPPEIQEYIEEDLEKAEECKKDKCSGHWSRLRYSENAAGPVKKSLCELPLVDLGRMDEDLVKRAISAYVDMGFPFLLKGMTTTWPAHKKWTKKGIKKHYGKAKINLKQDNWQYMSTCKASTSNFKGEEDGTIEELIDVFESLFPKDNLPKRDFRPPYMFSMDVAKKLPRDFYSDFSIPSFFVPDSKVNESVFTQMNMWPTNPIWTLGAPLSGTQPHRHLAAWNSLVYGMKRWYIQPPSVLLKKSGSDDYEIDGVQQWLEEDYPRLRRRPFECTQVPGDTVVVPPYWTHAVSNLQEGVGVAQEIGIPSSWAWTHRHLKSLFDWRV